ncbi:MAG TPA: HNH endonuclease signature motif containing protein [Tepidisphaeraceae bacterium]|jgi:hypothetical protein|nr:HNH endonuclease signature motif containing protein [Tepidisphaeraceae bacterium]
MQKAIDELVRRRAEHVCEYCHFPQPPFHIEHIIARKHGGITIERNLALSCARCNFHKGPNLSGIDPETGATVLLFHPRRDEWKEHFQWRRAVLVGLTPSGRATIKVLEMNHSARIAAREQLILEGLLQVEPDLDFR